MERSHGRRGGEGQQMRTRRWIGLIGLLLGLAACGNTGAPVGALNTVSVAVSPVPPTATTAPAAAAPTPSLVPTIVSQPSPTTAPTLAPTLGPTLAPTEAA